MTSSLRRSRRSPKRISDYNVGDIVEIERNGKALKGRLAQLLTEGTSPLPRWLIKFDGQPQKDEEMYERVFGKMISAIEVVEEEEEDDVPSSHSNSPPSSSQRRATKPQAGGSSSKHSGTSSEGEAGDEPKTKSSKTSDTNATSKTVQFSKSGTGSDDSSTAETGSEGKRMSARDRVSSAREARSSRRQAKIDEDLPLLEGGIVGEKRKILPPANHSKKRQRPSGGEVVIVKLLTGTLYLYRGQHRRAEFIRKV